MKNRLKHTAFLIVTVFQFVSVIISNMWGVYVVNAFAKAKLESITERLSLL
ncbi:hypothetical protein [uncultured Aquimarina sp.]|uniref:hypothetical protein n=1 Tax=uncultured Aquimarina sp. TaxID=575652 RepID=UPI0026330253|nr:hypothetical protein [uncultured Aquimarina sp.]